MGIWRKLFRRSEQPTSPPRAMWSLIAENLASALKLSENQFFKSCVKALSNAAIERPNLEIEVVNAEINLDVDSAIKAFQLYWALYYIEKYQYIVPDDGNDFSDLLFAYVVGTESALVKQHWNDYMEVEHDQTAFLARFAHDVARWITANEDVLLAGVCVAGQVGALIAATHVLVARCFFDKERADALKNEWMEKTEHDEK